MPEKSTKIKKPAVPSSPRLLRASKKEAKPKKIKPVATVKKIAAEIKEVKTEAVKSEAAISQIKKTAKPEEEKSEKKAKKYYEAVGRRKEAIARVRLFTIKPFEGEEGKITVNGKFYKNYFTIAELQQAAEAPLKKLKSLNRFEVVAMVKGGGQRGQAEAVRHGLARTLLIFNADFRKKLKKAGYLKRDPRAKERRKYGLKKARRAPQWAKR